MDRSEQQKIAQQILDPYRRRLYEDWQRYGTLKCVIEELERISRKKRFLIKNAFVWQAIDSIHRLLFIDVHALCVEGRGMIDKLRQKCAPTFRVPGKTAYRKLSGSRDSPMTADSGVRLQHERTTISLAFRELFPGQNPGDDKLPQTCWNSLMDRFSTIAISISPARNFHAHRGGDAQATDIRTSALEDTLQKLWEIVRNLYLLGTFKDIPLISNVPHNVVPNDIVDLLLLGNSNTIRREWGIEDPHRRPDMGWGWQLRDSYYEALHQSHEKNESASNFNDLALYGQRPKKNPL